MDVSIYIPEESVNVFRFHINQLANRTFDDWSYYHDVETFKTSARGRRIGTAHDEPAPAGRRDRVQAVAGFSAVHFKGRRVALGIGPDEKSPFRIDDGRGDNTA